MINSFHVLFDYNDFLSKLKHYFSDTAPIYATIELRLNKIRISADRKLPIDIIIDSGLSVKKNIDLIIKNCEQALYPKMLCITKVEQDISFSNEKIKEMLFMGLTLEQIHKKKAKIIWQRFIITRFNTSKDSIDYKDELSNKKYRAHFKRPLITYRDNILKLANSGQEGMCELYNLIMENSEIEELSDKDATISTNSN